MKKIILVSCFLLIGCEHFHRMVSGSYSAQPPRVFILAGQSNMEGGAHDAQAPTNPHVKVLGFDYKLKPASDPLNDPTGAIDPRPYDSDPGTGPGLYFANSLFEMDSSRDIILVPCSKGASNLWQWEPDTSRASLYGSCIERIKAARKYGEISGMIFWQGETEGRGADIVPDWASRFQGIIASFRRDVNVNFPVVFAQLGHFSWPPWNDIQRQQAGISILNGAMIVTDDIPTKSDIDIHYFAAGYKEAGKRFAEAMRPMLRN